MPHSGAVSFRSEPAVELLRRPTRYSGRANRADVLPVVLNRVEPRCRWHVPRLSDDTETVYRAVDWPARDFHGQETERWLAWPRSAWPSLLMRFDIRHRWDVLSDWTRCRRGWRAMRDDFRIESRTSPIG
jgi:hypothetical protein